MTIKVPVTKTIYGFVEVEVPDDSQLKNPNATPLQKKRAAKFLGIQAVRGNMPGKLEWDSEEGEVNVNLGYFED